MESDLKAKLSIPMPVVNYMLHMKRYLEYMVRLESVRLKTAKGLRHRHKTVAGMTSLTD